MRTIRKIIRGHLADVQGNVISRALPSDGVQQISPFLMLDHIGPTMSVPGKPLVIEDHPHRGFEPVTFLFEGANEHRDSGGGHGILDSGDVQWMTAGSGIVHREGSRPEYLHEACPFHAIQLWVNLPAEHKMTRPKYQDIKAATIPAYEANGTRLRVIAGEYMGLHGPASTFTPMLVLHGSARAGSLVDIAVPERFNLLVYVTIGSLRSDGQVIGARKLAWYDHNGPGIQLFAPEAAEFVVLAGEPIDEPMAASGPFVMNTHQEIAQAFADYQAGRMGQIV